MSKKISRAPKVLVPNEDSHNEGESDIDIYDEESIVSALDALQKGHPPRSVHQIQHSVKKTASPRKNAVEPKAAALPSPIEFGDLSSQRSTPLLQNTQSLSAGPEPLKSQPRFSQESDIDATRAKLASTLRWPNAKQIEDATERVVSNLGRRAVDTRIRDLEILVRREFADLESYGATSLAAYEDVESFWKRNSSSVSKVAVAVLSDNLASPRRKSAVMPRSRLSAAEPPHESASPKTGSRSTRSTDQVSDALPRQPGRPPNSLRTSTATERLRQDRQSKTDNQGGKESNNAFIGRVTSADDAPNPDTAARKRGRPRKDISESGTAQRPRKRKDEQVFEVLPPRRAKLSARPSSAQSEVKAETLTPPGVAPTSGDGLVSRKRKYRKTKQLAPRPLEQLRRPPHVPFVPPHSSESSDEDGSNMKPSRIQPSRVVKLRDDGGIEPEIPSERNKPPPPPEDIYRTHLRYTVKDDNNLRRLVEKIKPNRRPEKWAAIANAMQRSVAGVRQRWFHIKHFVEEKARAKAEFTRSGVFRSGVGYFNMIHKALEEHGGIATRAEIIYHIATHFSQWLNYELSSKGVPKWRRAVLSCLNREPRFRKISKDHYQLVVGVARDEETASEDDADESRDDKRKRDQLNVGLNESEDDQSEPLAKRSKVAARNQSTEESDDE